MDKGRKYRVIVYVRVGIGILMGESKEQEVNLDQVDWKLIMKGF